jgi:hypothetical protein
MKFKSIAAAVALAAAGAAHANINNASSYGDAVEAFVTVFNSKASITIDLGLDHNTFESNLSAPIAFNLAADTNWNTFLTAANGGGALLWSVQSIDQDENNGWTTARIGQEALAGTTTGGARLNGNLDTNYSDLVGRFMNFVNTDGTPSLNVSTVAAAGSEQYWNMDGANTATGFFKTSNVIGSGAVSLFNFRDNLQDPYNAAAKYDWKKSTDTVTLDSNYVLTFQGAAVTPAVPEPESYALALVALAAVGFVARRRQA